MFLSPAIRCLGVVLGSAAALGCGGAEPHFAALGEGERPEPSASNDHSRSARSTRGPQGEGTLEVVAQSGVASYLGHWGAVVTDAEGRVVAGAEADEDAPAEAGAEAGPDLRLSVPEGDGYTLTLTASTTGADPVVCRAQVGPLRIEGGAVASARVLAWDCGGPRGYVPTTVASECFWLAEWLYVARTSAAVGQEIDVSAAGHDVHGNPARFDWSAGSPRLGRFAEPQAARTSFHCDRPGEDQPLTVAISDSECRALVSQLVACR